MGVYSDGSYGAPAGVVYSFPVTCKDGKWSIVQVRWVGGGWGEKVDWGGDEAAEAAAGTLRSVPPLEHHAQVSSHPTRRTQAHACMHPCLQAEWHNYAEAERAEAQRRRVGAGCRGGGCMQYCMQCRLSRSGCAPTDRRKAAAVHSSCWATPAPASSLAST